MKRLFVVWMTGLVALAVLATACAPTGGEVESGAMEGETKTLYVGPEQVDCTGVAPQQCLQVREDPNADYELFYSQIEGFTFEPGYEYELRVRVEPVENAPADASSLRYTLVEIVSQTPVDDSVKSDVTPVPNEVAGLVGVRWVVETYLNAEGVMVAPVADTELTATFDLEQVGGHAGCNQYFGSYSVDGNALTIGQVGSTMMACEPAELMQQETDFLTALQSAATFAIEGDQLTIANAAGENVLTFVASEPASLTGTAWVATMTNTGTEAVSTVMVDTTITANFTEDGHLNGSAGCNNYMTGYTVDGQNITIEPPASTRKLCPEPEGVMEQEVAFLTLLPQAATYSINGETLELRTADGALIASFAPAQ